MAARSASARHVQAYLRDLAGTGFSSGVSQVSSQADTSARSTVTARYSQSFRVKRHVIANEGGNKEVAVVVALLPAHRDLATGLDRKSVV